MDIEWACGDLAKLLVKDVMEKKGDANGFMAAWVAYCDGIGMTDEAFRKGYVDRSRKAKTIKRKRKAKQG